MTTLSGVAFASTGGTSAPSSSQSHHSATGKQSSSGVSAELRKIAACESGGNPHAVSPDGRYRGKYQFDAHTWRTYGGSGDPAKMPSSAQDRVARKLYHRLGTSPWPNCA